MPYTIGAIINGLYFAATGSTFAAGTAYAASTVTIFGTTVTVAEITGTVALTAASLALTPSTPSPASTKVPLRNPIGTRTRHYGRVRVSGEIAELKVSYTLNSDGDGVLFIATMFQTGEIDAYEKFYIHDQEVRISDADIVIVVPPWWPGPSSHTISGQVTYPGVFLDNLRVQLHTHTGTASQSVDASLAEAFPARWTDTHRLDGIAYIVGRFNGVPIEDFSTVYSFGIPKVSTTFRASKVWDPRDDAQDPDDPTTWTWTTNAARIILDYLWHDDGMRLPRSMMESALDHWIEQIDLCDEDADLIGGDTEPRYQLSGSYAYTDPRKDILKRMLSPIDGRLRLREDFGVILEVGRFETPTDAETFGLKDIVSISLKRGATKPELKNEIRFTYTSSGHNFQPQEGDAYRDEASIELDGLESAVLDLAWCPSHRQGRLRAKVEGARMNPEWLGQIVLGPRGFNLRGKRYIHLTIPFLNIDTTFYLTEPAKIDVETGAVTCQVVSFPASAYELSLAEQGVSPENETPGTWGITVPEDTTEVTITADGAGGGGSGGDGGGGGARCIKTIAIDPADWGTIIQFTVGAGGQGDPQNLALSTDGGDSTVTATLVAGAIAMVAEGGDSGLNGDEGGLASGGDTNTPGGDADGGNGGVAGSGATENEAPGGGGHEGVDGGHGKVTFDWVYS